MLEVGETFSSGTFKVTDSFGAPGAATVTVVVTLPDGTTTAPTVANPATGDYTFDYLTTQLGRHPYVLTATSGVLGTFVRKVADVFVVGAASAAGIVALSEVKEHLNIPATNTASDRELELKIAAATEKIEFRCGAVVRRTIINERHDGSKAAVWLYEAPIISVTSVVPVNASYGGPVDVADIEAETCGRVTYFNGCTRFPIGPHYWTYVAGVVPIPAGLREAALNFVKGSWETQRGASGLPWQGAADESVEVPGMGLVMWRLEQDLQPFLRPPGQA
jgi:hypothetical protein